LEKRQIPVVQSGNFDDISARIPKCAQRRDCKAGSVEVAEKRSVASRQIAIASSVGTLERKATHIRTVSGNRYRKSIARVKTRDSVDLPAFHQLAGYPGSV